MKLWTRFSSRYTTCNRVSSIFGTRILQFDLGDSQSTEAFSRWIPQGGATSPVLFLLVSGYNFTDPEQEGGDVWR